MENMYFTITGLKYRYGSKFLENPNKEFTVKLVKEPDNEYDTEAIRVELAPLGLIGYVANSHYTVIGECLSAGRLYDKIGDTAYGTVEYVLPNGVVCKLKEDSVEKPWKRIIKK